ESERAQEPEALAEALAQLHLERVELRLARVLDRREGAVLRIGPALLHIPGTRRRLVLVAHHLERPAPGPDVRPLHHHVEGKLALEADVPLMEVRAAEPAVDRR